MLRLLLPPPPPMMIMMMRMMMLLQLMLLLQKHVALCEGRIIDFEVEGGACCDDSLETEVANLRVLNRTIANLRRGDTLVIPAGKEFFTMGGVAAANVRDASLRIDGNLTFSKNIKHWPRHANGDVFHCLFFSNFSNFTIASAERGVVDGQGAAWWGIPGIGYLVHGENRPRLLEMASCSDILVENLLLRQSPYWTVWIHNVDGLEIRWTDIDVRRDAADSHDIFDLSAFNTDGFDVSGRNVWIHDCNVWNQDDCVCVKDGSENMVFERINASGVGLTIGSIGDNNFVRNITFRDCNMHKTYKGIYMKFRGPGTISDVLYENIHINEPTQWPIFIGPAQQSDSDNLCAAHPCSICWPTLPSAQCNAPRNAYFRNITLRNVTVNDPKMSPGVILADASSSPMEGLVFDRVRFQNAKSEPFDNYYCKGNGDAVATGGTTPVPPCFTVRP